MGYNVIGAERVGSGVAMSGIRNGMRVMEHDETAAVIEPGVLHVWGEVTELSIDFAPQKPGHAGEYCVEFVSGATATVLSLPEAVQWPEDPVVEANKRYQLSVVDNVGLIAGVEYIPQA